MQESNPFDTQQASSVRVTQVYGMIIIISEIYWCIALAFKFGRKQPLCDKMNDENI